MLSCKSEPELKDLLDELLQNLTRKDEVIENLQKDVLHLDRKMNELERYSSKECIIILNLPLFSGSNVMQDAVDFFWNVFETNVNVVDHVACRSLGPFTDIRKSPPVLNLSTFGKKCIWDRKFWLTDFLNCVNNKPVYMRERMTKKDKDLME